MAGAYSAVVSVMTVMDNLRTHYPPISLDPRQAESLTQHLTFFEKFLAIYDQTLPYSTQADPFESRIANAAYAAEDAIESHIVDCVRGSSYEARQKLYSSTSSSVSEKSEGSDEVLEEFVDNATEADPLEAQDANGEDDISSESDGSLNEALQNLYSVMDPARGEGSSSSSDASLYETLEKVIQQMESIKKEAIMIKQTMVVGVQHQPTPLYSFRSSSVSEKTSMVGADHLLLRMKEKLVSDYWRDLQTFPVVGMGGTGKTTLAINIYQDRLIEDHFDIRAWATISQQYSIQEILLEVLSGLKLEGDEYLSEDALGEILYKHLFGRRYLIVMDDMWSIGAWDGIRRFLPDNENGSRIVVTTRLSDLASKLSNSNSLKMELLDVTDSWDLLSKIVFGGEGCPPELEEIGKEIGKSCKGLPLSIVVIGGFLAKFECTREFWKYVEENLGIIWNLEDYERCLKILHMSYKQLPVYLKPCFLYMGVFPEDDVIRTSKLVKLWVAEGFLKPVSGRSTLEEIARGYLKDLVDRNLVLIDKMGVSGNIKSCKIHDLLRDLCLREAEKEMFYTLTPQGIVNGQRRIVINDTTSKDEDISFLSPMPPVRSLIWNLKWNELPPLSFRLLRVLVSHAYNSTPSTNFVENVHRLVNARFLYLRGEEFTKTPISIMKFWNLQTVIMYSFQNMIADMQNFWYMSHIRHLVIPDFIYLPDPHEGQDGIVLGNLQTLLGAINFKCSDQVVKRIPNLKKLRAWYVGGSLDDDKDCLTNLDRLDKLESLDFTIDLRMNPSGAVSSQRLINFPCSLKKLRMRIGLSDSDYWEQEVLDKIGSLPFVQKLKLSGGRFKDGHWETTEGQFRSLKFLVLSHCKNLQVWTTESSHFPCLSHLRLNWIKDLEEFPLDLAEVSTLRLIEVHECNESSVVSLKRILEGYEELHGEADLLVKVWLPNPTNREALKSLEGPNFRIYFSKPRLRGK